MHAGFRFADLGDTSTNRREQQTNQNLIDHERSEEIRVLCPDHEIQ